MNSYFHSKPPLSKNKVKKIKNNFVFFNAFWCLLKAVFMYHRISTVFSNNHSVTSEFNYLIALVLLYHGTFLLVDWLIDWLDSSNKYFIRGLQRQSRHFIATIARKWNGLLNAHIHHGSWYLNTVFSNSHPVTSEFDYSQQTVNTLSVTEVTVTYYQCNVCVCAYIHT